MPYLNDLLPVKQKEFLPFEDWQLETAASEKFNLPDPSIYYNQANLYRRISSLFTAVDLVASAGALTDFSVARLVSGKEPKDIPNHEFEQLLDHPNPLDSRYEFLYATIAFWKLNKNSYWWLNRPDEYSPPQEIWFIPPHMIQPVPDGNMFLRGYYYDPGNGKELFLPPHEIVHFKGFNPFSRFVGLSAAIESLSMIAMGYLGMTEWQTKLYKQSNARLPGILSFEQMIADPTWEKIKADTREAASNREMLMLRGVGQGIKWQQASATQREMEFIETLDMIDKKIMDAMAPGAYTMLYENANEANSRTGKATFNELSVYPVHVMMSEKITNSILPAYPGRPLTGHFEDVRIADKQMELTEQQEYAKTHTINKINEKYYQGDEVFDDDRGKLIPVQLNAQSGDIQKPPPAPNPPLPFGRNGNTPEVLPDELKQTENEPPKIPQELEQAQKAQVVLDALSKFERYALRHIGKAIKFDNEFIPTETLTQLRTELTACKTEAAVKTVFKPHKERYRIAPPATNDVTLVLKEIRLALQKL